MGTNVTNSWGLEKGLDVSICAKPEFDELQIIQILEGLENNVDVTPYLNPGIDWKEMKRIRLKLESNK